MEAYMHEYDSVCLESIRTVMDIFGSKWAFLVLEELHRGTMRFSHIRNDLGISTKSLTDVLRKFEDNGIVNREVTATVPVTVNYSLTEKARAFDDVLLSMKKWGINWCR